MPHAASVWKPADNSRKPGILVLPVMLDVTNTTQIASLAANIRSRFGYLDILVNNAGLLWDDVALKPLQQTLACWRETFDTNVFAVVEVTQALLPFASCRAVCPHRPSMASRSRPTTPRKG